MQRQPPRALLSSALRSALEYNDDLYEQCLAVIKKSSIKKMMLSFPLCSKFSVENACMLADALPISIESFDFGFDNVDKQAGEIFVKALARRLMETRYALPSKKFGGPLKYLGLKSNRITNEAATQIGNALSVSTMPNLQVLDFGFPVPFGFEAALAITECAFQEKDVLPRPLSFTAEPPLRLCQREQQQPHLSRSHPHRRRRVHQSRSAHSSRSTSRTTISTTTASPPSRRRSNQVRAASTSCPSCVRLTSRTTRR